ncbi:MAG: hypothetical protein R3C03_07910 [Pirellulaceae bacterium]
MTVIQSFGRLGRLEDQTVNENTLFDDLVDFLLEGQEPSRILAFRLPASKQVRLDELLELNREGTLSPEQLNELTTFETLEHVVRLMKARVAGRAAS